MKTMLGEGNWREEIYNGYSRLRANQLIILMSSWAIREIKLEVG